MSPSGVHLNKAVVFLIVGLFICVVVVYKFTRSPKATESSEATGNMLSIKLNDQSISIFTQSEKPAGVAKLDILFLHGMSFTSQNWVDIGTLKLLAENGYNAIAIDLPGFGKSKGVKISDEVAFMEALISGLKLTKPVIVSPSMSGQFSLPFLFNKPETATSRSAGYVPVAPVQTSQFKDKFAKSQIPTLIVFGSRDNHLGAQSKKNFEALPNKTIFEIDDAGHACYLDKPAVFHKGLLKFLSSLTK